MAVDAYLQIDSIKGESTDERHRDWLEVRGGAQGNSSGGWYCNANKVC
jgi:type VI secretion system secreted protein Hcp